jgi:endonuclease YncB( thermonuclease family)
MDLTTFILAFIVLTKFDRAYSTSYTVVKVTDGDTISVRVDNQKKLMRVRFL